MQFLVEISGVKARTSAIRFPLAAISMKHRIQLLLVFFFVSFYNAQNSDWTEIKKNYFQKVINENSKELLENNDSIQLSALEAIETDGKVENFDFGKFLFGEKMKFEEFKSKLDIKEFKQNLKKNSEYLIKIEIPREKFITYTIYLSDLANNKHVNELKKFIKENFQLETIIYISKEDSANEAKKLLGIDGADLFEQNIFPASLEITTKNQIDLKKVQKRYPKIIDEFKSNEQKLKSVTLQIKT